MKKNLAAFILAIVLYGTSTHAAIINFTGPLGVIDVDSGTTTYSGVPVGTHFTGSIDDATASGSISDGVTTTPFGCCIAAGGLSIANDSVLSADDAAFLNTLAGSDLFNSGDVFDSVDIEGDATTAGNGRIEVGLSFVLSPDAFTNADLSNYPFNPNDLIMALFFILEENTGSFDLYSAAGNITSIPVPAAAWLLGSALGLLGWFGRVIGPSRPERLADVE